MRIALVFLPAFILLASCASSSAPPPAAKTPETSMEMMNSIIVANGCTKLGAASGALAQKAMRALVEGCSEVPGGSAEFTATLMPGGRINLGAISGTDPDRVTVPLCVLKHPLVHSVPLPAPCKLDVRMEQLTMKMPRDAGVDATQ